jgi:hypothetical protein
MILARTRYLGPLYQVASAADRVAKTEEWWKMEPDLYIGMLDWWYRNDIAAIAADNWSVEVAQFELGAERSYPFQNAIPGLGLTLGEFWWLDELSRVCEAEGRWEFFLAAQPLNVANVSGAVLNPFAVF